MVILVEDLSMSRAILYKPKKIMRNRLDFILTDLLPVEIPDLFSFVSFYGYILEKRHELNKKIDNLKVETAKNTQVPFKDSWASLPLSYTILKGDDACRKMALMNPLSALNSYLFLELYEDVMLLESEKGKRTSLRYHVRSRDLYYKGRKSGAATYFRNKRNIIRMDRGEIQQTGAYFNIAPFHSVQSFTESKKWLLLNSKYASFAHLDFKNCFDSIYSHVYTWINTRDVIDSKGASNANLYVAIDRLLQNLNGHLSHGVLVGPEFSRFIVELLMQKNDDALIARMKKHGVTFGVDYEFYRYVDDLYVFAKSEILLGTIIKELGAVSKERNLALNDSKTQVLKCPVYLDEWLSDALVCADGISTCFSNETENNEKEQYYCSIKGKNFNRFVLSFYALIRKYPDKKRKIVSYLLSTVLRSLQRKKSDVKLFKEKDTRTPLKLLRYCFFMLSHAPVFEHFQKVISIMEFVYGECPNEDVKIIRNRMQKILYDYENMALKSTISDIGNFLIVLNEFGLRFSQTMEKKLEKNVLESGNPLMMAAWLYYSRYDSDYLENISDKISGIIHEKMESFCVNDSFMDIGMWYIYIFVKCPHISHSLRGEMRKNVCKVIQEETSKANQYLNSYIKVLICEYLNDPKRPAFFDWGNSQISKASQIAYRTYKRTVFRGFGKRYAFTY